MSRIAPGDVLEALISKLDPLVVGLAGLPGCGKTTLARRLAESSRQPALAMSLDDFYLSRSEREARGLRWRGGPGSHDVRSLLTVLDAIRARVVPVEVPRYSAARDDRDEPIVLRAPVDLVLLDGWFLGYPAGAYADVLHQLDLLVFLDLPVEIAREQRFAREDALRAAGGGFSEEQMERFWDEVLAPGIETLVPEARASADVVLSLDEEHRVTSMRSARADVRAVLDSAG